MASICSVTFMEPSSLAMPEELRPATISAVSTGPSSRTRVIDTSVPVLSDLAVLRQRAGHLQRHHGAAEEAGQSHDRQAADADGVHLQDDVVAVVRRAEDVAEGAARRARRSPEPREQALSADRASRSVPELRCYHTSVAVEPRPSHERISPTSPAFASATSRISRRSPAARRFCASRARWAGWTFAARPAEPRRRPRSTRAT